MHHTISDMHIGIDCRLPTYQMGGISQYAIHLVQALASLDDSDQFTIFHSRKETRNFVPAGNIRFSRSNLWTPCHHPLERYTLAVELIPHRLDILHSPDFIPPITGAKRRIITVHDLTFLYYPEFLTAESRRYYKEQIEWAASVADHIIADSEATRNDIIRLLDVTPSKITTIHLAANPIYAASYTTEDIAKTLAEYNLTDGYILAVGTLEPRKNLNTLLKAYHELRQAGFEDIPLLLIGDKGWMFDDIFKTIIKLDLVDSVYHLRGVSNIQLAHIYRAAGLLAFPSYYEGFGLPALEAMHAGCPVISSNRGSLPEVVGDAAISLDPDDVSAWTHALARVLGSPSLAQQMSRAGHIQAQKFSWENTAARTLEVYQAMDGI